MGKIVIGKKVEKKRKKYKRVKGYAMIGGWTEHFKMGEVFEAGDRDIAGNNLSTNDSSILLLKPPKFNHPLYCDASCFEEVDDE